MFPYTKTCCTCIDAGKGKFRDIPESWRCAVDGSVGWLRPVALEQLRTPSQRLPQRRGDVALPERSGPCSQVRNDNHRAMIIGKPYFGTGQHRPFGDSPEGPICCQLAIAVAGMIFPEREPCLSLEENTQKSHINNAIVNIFD